jgi:hypothetical protein
LFFCWTDAVGSLGKQVDHYFAHDRRLVDDCNAGQLLEHDCGERLHSRKQLINKLEMIAAAPPPHCVVVKRMMSPNWQAIDPNLIQLDGRGVAKKEISNIVMCYRRYFHIVIVYHC